MASSGAKRPASPTRAISPPPVKRKIESTLTKKSVSSFFTPTSQKKPEQIAWRIVNNSLVVGKYAKESDYKQTAEKPRVAAFDLDSTLVSTASGNTFPRNSSDWKWWHDTVPSKLKELSADGYHVIVISNQKTVSLKKEMKGGHSESKSLTNFKERATAVMQQLDIPISVYAATLDDGYRKPRIGMWREFLDDYDFDVAGVDLSNSVFVGDAAGRPNDHSQVDRGFAANAGVPFKTPEEFFLNAAPEPLVEPFDPSLYMQSEADDVSPPFSRQSALELVIFCGSPGAGKSTFYWDYLEPLGYERVNQDTLKTRPKCIKVAKEHLAARRSVVVDNTNADPETRAHWIEVAKEFNVPIRCVYFSASPTLCRHNNAVRAANQSLNPESRALLPGIAFGDFGRRHKEPTMSEGFKDIIRVDFRFRGNDEVKKIWKQYWI
ncbi:polynucleotide kinase 3 phosphatase-domain-containing protein [Aspergillus leporis]|uniref:Polynucleotide kinase 3 phosphatase-domain-containing protein n=1 Tax=Aspergillus leporis TaxID=41062 RepID=A0A5N5WNV8_9EURO|nr:polynucleotide kinase 3 phosphatase-domain-containing protein [Aspergillus leporis]